MHVPPAVAVRRRRWPLVVLVVLALLVAAWVWVVPRVVAGSLVGQLRAAGFADARVGDVAVALDRVDVHDLVFGNGRAGEVHVPHATASFRIDDLWHRRIDSLVLEQPSWRPAVGAAAPGGGDAAARPEPTAPHAADGDAKQPAPAPALERALPVLPLRHLELRQARLGDDTVVDATLTAADGRWDVLVAGTSFGHALHATARLREVAAAAVGEVTVQLRGKSAFVLAGSCRVDLLDGERVLDLAVQRGEGPYDVAVGATGWSGGGGLALRAHVPLADLDAATVGVRLERFDLASAAGLQLDALSGELQLVGLPLPVTGSAQVLRWQRLRFAKVQAGAGELWFELDPDRELLATVRQHALDDVGAVEIRGLRLAPGVTSLPATIAFDQVALREWLELLSRGRITGEGRVTGTVDVVVHTAPQLELDLRGGEVAAVRGGLVRFLEDEQTRQLVRQHAEQIAAAAGHGNVVKERIVGALEEFEYDELEFRIDPDAEGDGVTLRVHASGKGRKVPQQLELDVNLRGFDEAVDTALALKLGLDRAKRRLDDKIEGNPSTTTGPRGQR